MVTPPAFPRRNIDVLHAFDRAASDWRPGFPRRHICRRCAPAPRPVRRPLSSTCTVAFGIGCGAGRHCDSGAAERRGTGCRRGAVSADCRCGGRRCRLRVDRRTAVSVRGAGGWAAAGTAAWHGRGLSTALACAQHRMAPALIPGIDSRTDQHHHHHHASAGSGEPQEIGGRPPSPTLPPWAPGSGMGPVCPFRQNAAFSRRLPEPAAPRPAISSSSSPRRWAYWRTKLLANTPPGRLVELLGLDGLQKAADDLQFVRDLVEIEIAPEPFAAQVSPMEVIRAVS